MTQPAPARPFGRLVFPLLLAGGLGCGGPTAPAHPTWADVQPILAGECSSCHGASAAQTGNGYRFDFYDMTSAVCGPAVAVLGEGARMADALADQIWTDISTPANMPNVRPLMPPPPAPYLPSWEWQTIQKWVNDGAPRGGMPPGNRPARFRFYNSASTADQTLDITGVVEDPDGDPVVGILNIGPLPFKMDHAGAFSTRIDTSQWPAGDLTVNAVLCDGWSNVSYAVGTLTIDHASP